MSYAGSVKLKLMFHAAFMKEKTMGIFEQKFD